MRSKKLSDILAFIQTESTKEDLQEIEHIWDLRNFQLNCINNRTEQQACRIKIVELMKEVCKTLETIAKSWSQYDSEQTGGLFIEYSLGDLSFLADCCGSYDIINSKTKKEPSDEEYVNKNITFPLDSLDWEHLDFIEDRIVIPLKIEG